MHRQDKLTIGIMDLNNLDSSAFFHKLLPQTPDSYSALCRIEQLEIFDEFEEWHLIQVLVHACARMYFLVLLVGMERCMQRLTAHIIHAGTSQDPAQLILKESGMQINQLTRPGLSIEQTSHVADWNHWKGQGALSNWLYWLCMQEHYCVAVGINDALGIFENFDFERYTGISLQHVPTAR